MELLKKSDDNFQSAKYLYNNNLYASSVHCCYYSCFQTSITKYISISNRSYEDVKKEIIDNNKHVHSYYIDKLKGIFINTSQDINKHSINRKIHNMYKSLKFMRIDADYNDVEIDQSTAQNAIDYCEKLNELLKNIT